MKKKEITVVSLGPGSPDLITCQAREQLLRTDQQLILRTARHPVGDWLSGQQIPFRSLDSFYEVHEDFDEMHRAMADFLWNESARGRVCFGVMDPVTDGAVAAVKAACPAGALLQVMPGVSAAQACLTALPAETSLSGGLRLYSSADFLSAPAEPAVSLFITELDSALLAGEIKLKLSEIHGEEEEVFFFPPDAAGCGIPRPIPLFRLDGQKKYDHTAAVFVPGKDYRHRSRFTFEDLTAIVSRLRAPDGCPWDRVQTHESLRPYLVEEAWEAVGAIDEGDMDHLADELGDVLFQVMIHASIGESFDEFTLTDVISGICSKMIKRHPHVFVSPDGQNAEQISQGWEARKRAETGSKSVGETLDDVSAFLPALKYSIKMYKKLCQVPALRRDPAQIAQEIHQLSGQLMAGKSLSPRAMSQLLMKCTELCFQTDQDAEIQLHQGVDQLKKQYQRAEKIMMREGAEPERLSLEQIKAYMNRAEEERD